MTPLGRQRFARLAPHLPRMFGFLVLPGISYLSTLAVLPVITSEFGARGWPAVALGTSVGATAGVVSELGWGVSGPAHIARARPAARGRLYMLSLATQVFACVPASVVAAIIAFLLSPHYRGVAAFMAIAACWAAIGPSWFFIGSGEPMKIATTTTIPNTLAALAASAWMWFGGPLWAFPLAVFGAAIYGLYRGVHLSGAKRGDLAGYGRRRLMTVFKIQWLALQGNIASSIYILLPTTVVALVNPAAIGIFSAADRLQRQALSVLKAVPQAFQNWVGGAGASQLRRDRALRAVKYNCVIGCAAGVGFAVLAPEVSRLLFTGEFTLDYTYTILCAVIIASTVTSRATGRIGLVIFRRIGTLRTSALAGGLVGIALICVFAVLWGAHGALLGSVAAELTVLLIQLVGLRRVIRARRGAVIETAGQEGHPSGTDDAESSKGASRR